MNDSPLPASAVLLRLKKICPEVDSSLEALYRTARDYEAFNGNFFALILADVRARVEETSSITQICLVWTEYLSIVEEIKERRQAHILKKFACTMCIEQRWCPCDTVYPDFNNYRNRLQNVISSAETSLLMNSQKISYEEAQVLIALSSDCVLTASFG